MCRFKLFTIAAAALMMAACSTEDITQQPKTGEMQFTATIAAPNSGATTRTEYTEVTTGEAAGTINVVWEVGDEIALIHDGVKDVATVKTVNADGSATITGFITKAENGDGVEVCYPAAAWEWYAEKSCAIRNETFVTNITTKQDGTLKYIQDNLDTRMGKGTLKVDGDNATLSASATLESQIAIWKLALQDDAETPAPLSATQVSVKKGGEQPVPLAGTTTLGTATSTVYLAIDKFSDQKVTIEATVGDKTYKYEKEGVSLALGQYYQSTVNMTMVKTIDLSTVTENTTIGNFTTLTGTLGKNVKISIAAGATVTLDDVTINGVNNESYKWAGITCEGDAIIILKGTNTVKGFYEDYPGIQVSSEGTLTIKGTGSLTASSNGKGAGIGGGYGIACGNIIIEGGTITATGGQWAAGIGSGSGETCSDITISGGTVTATGGSNAAGIGSGNNAGCGDIKITSGVTQVTATKGSSAENSIGKGRLGYCGTVTIGCTLDNDGKPVGGTTGAITTSPYTYDPNAPVYTMAANATAGDVGKLICTDGHIHTYNADAACTKSRVAKIIYVGSSTGDATYNHGLALALTDESSSKDWDNAKTACTNKNTSATVESASWMLPSKTQWETMGATSSTYTTLRNGFTSVGGSNLQSNGYWSSTEDGSTAWQFLFGTGGWLKVPKGGENPVRACLAF